MFNCLHNYKHYLYKYEQGVDKNCIARVSVSKFSVISSLMMMQTHGSGYTTYCKHVQETYRVGQKKPDLFER